MLGEPSLGDLLATAAIFALWVGPAALLLAGLFCIRWFRNSRAIPIVATIAYSIYAVGMGAIAWYHNVGISQWDYPDLAAAFAQASPRERGAMCRVARSARSRREIFSLSLARRDEFLAAGGYCTPLGSQSPCKRVPKGSEAIGMVIESFPSGEHGPSCPSPELLLPSG